MQLFVSYAHVNKLLVMEIANLLTEGGQSVWFDHRLLPGEVWKEVLLKEISQCEIFVYVLSPDSVTSEWCQWEFEKAVEFEKPILPILLQRDTQIPDTLKEIEKYQFADFSDGVNPATIARLIGGLNKITIKVPHLRKLDTPNNPRGFPPQGYLVSKQKNMSDWGDIEGDRSALRIVAGPGTGKTTSLMRQIAQLLKQNTDPRRILVVTFTRTAAKDIEKALQSMNVSQVNQIRRGTLHSFCFSVLKQAHMFLQTGRIVRPLLTFEERFLLEDLWSNGDFGDIHQRRKRLKAFEAVWARQQDQEPGWSMNEVDRNFQTELYEWLRFHRAMLISEIIPETLNYLRNNPGCSELQQYHHILVDEYQDLNRAEQSLVRLLSTKGMLTVVGDEDQSIYEDFRYAHPESMYDSGESYFYDGDPLNTCYRCPTRIVEMANNLIRNNKNRMGRILKTYQQNSEGELHIVQWQNMEDEAQGIAKFIDQRISNGQFDPGEVLILCPRRQFGYLIRDALERLNRPAHSFFHEQYLEGSPKEDGDY
ncbi:MAG: UvrD-helicase domain-containing protein, partial [Anaerolineae bacterium]|nr:UvrD-helicase domain-containing protein [Anaerolineae bacterium]